MEFANDEAERLNAFLDAQAGRHETDPDGLDPELAATYAQVKTLHARPTPDPTLKANLWRTMMTTSQPAIAYNAPAIPAARATTAPRP